MPSYVLHVAPLLLAATVRAAAPQMENPWATTNWTDFAPSEDVWYNITDDADAHAMFFILSHMGQFMADKPVRNVDSARGRRLETHTARENADVFAAAIAEVANAKEEDLTVTISAVGRRLEEDQIESGTLSLIHI